MSELNPPPKNKQEFIDALYAAGWEAPRDAQWENVSKLYESMNTRTDNSELLEALKDLWAWIDTESYSCGAVDGYDYNSGVEYGLRKVAIELKKRITAISNAEK